MRNDFEKAFHNARQQFESEHADTTEEQLKLARRAYDLSRFVEDTVTSALKPRGPQPTFTPNATRIANPAKRKLSLTTSEYAIDFVVTVSIQPGIGYSKVKCSTCV